jgi:hypothetical protein
MSRTRRVRLWPTGEARSRYKVVTLTDCTAALREEEQRLAVTKNYPMFSRFVMPNFSTNSVGRRRAEQNLAAMKGPERTAKRAASSPVA